MWQTRWNSLPGEKCFVECPYYDDDRAYDITCLSSGIWDGIGECQLGIANFTLATTNSYYFLQLLKQVYL